MHRGRRMALLAATLSTEGDPVSKSSDQQQRPYPRWGVAWTHAEADPALPEGFIIEAKIRLSREEAASFVLMHGGAMVESTIRQVDPHVPITLVHASRGKLTRAEPVAAKYEQKKMHHVGAYPRLESQMTTYDGSGDSPDRMDALVWATTDLMIHESTEVHEANYLHDGDDEEAA